jgi:epoxide hydrolase 4
MDLAALGIPSPPIAAATDGTFPASWFVMQELHDVQHEFIRTADVRLHYVAAGRGQTVLLLHGFPDFWYGWRNQIPALAAGGFRAVAPDLRGYNESDRPRGVSSYSLTALVQDVSHLISNVAPEGVILAGHDWGGVIAWRLAAQRPDLVKRLIILNAPHHAAFRRELTRNPRQLLRSWYVLANQLPRLPELLLSAFDYAVLRRVLRRGASGTPLMSELELHRYIAVFSTEYALTAALNYYRAAARDMLRGDSVRPEVTVPTLVLWGEQDPYLDRRLLDDLVKWVPQLHLESLPHAGHFLHWEDAATVNELLLAFLSPPPGRT